MTGAPTPFRILWRTFVEQFAANESATSDLQMRRAIIGVVTFLVTPGLFLMMKTMSGYELMVVVARHRNMPQIVEAFLAQMAVLFVSFSMISIGLLTVFIWDTLVFDKRDAMVLGPLPLRGSTVVGAKLAALATFLVGTALAVNIVSGVAFGFVTGAIDGRILQHLAGHLSGTVGGAVFMFCSLVVVRGLLVLLVSTHIAATVGSLLQFVFLSGVLVFMMVPTATGQVAPPISWFAALFELIRGSQLPAVPGLAQYGLIGLPISVAGAIAVTFASVKAAWVFRAHCQLPTVSYWSGVRAAMFAFAIGPALLLNALIVLPLVGWRLAAIHTLVVTLAIAITAQFASLLVEGLPFTRAYPPGHARLKTRWHFYLLGMWAIAYVPVRMEQQVLNDALGFAVLMLTGFGVLGVLEIAGRRRARTWTMPPDSEMGDADPEALTFLNLGPDAGHTPVGAGSTKQDPAYVRT